MRLSELEPRWWSDGESRHGMGISFLCPHCRTEMLSVAFANPIDGGAPYELPTAKLWQRTGDTFDTLTLSPSVDASHYGHWHGHVTNGATV